MADEVRFLGDLQRIDVKPGDRFVLSVPEPISMETAERLKAHWHQVMGDDVPVIVLGDGIRVGVIGAAEDADNF